MSFESNRFLTGNFTVAEAEAWIAAAELARQGISAPPPPALSEVEGPALSEVEGNPSSSLPASLSPLPSPDQLITRSPDLATAPPSALPQTSIVEDDVLADEMCIDDSPQLLKSLPIIQQRVLIELCTGRSMRQAARTCGINRATIQRWMHHDARFIAAYNQTIEFQQKEAAIRMAGMLPKSMDNLNEEVQHGDMKASLFVINNATKIPHGSLSPRKIAKRIRRRDQQLEEFLNSSDDDGQRAAEPPVITSTIGEPPAPAALPPVEERENFAEKKGEIPPAAPDALDPGTA